MQKNGVLKLWFLVFLIAFFAQFSAQPNDLSCTTSADCINGDGCFQGRCVHTSIAVNKPDSVYIKVSPEKQDNSKVLTWTVHNTSDTPAIIASAESIDCDEDKAECQILDLDSTANLFGFSSLPENELFQYETQNESDAFSQPFEMRDITVSGNWKRISFKKPFSQPPVVVVKPVSLEEDRRPVVTRVRNITNTGFDVRLQSWGLNYVMGLGAVVKQLNPAPEMKASYMAVLPGVHNVNGLKIEAGVTTAGVSLLGRLNKAGPNLKKISFSSAFSSQPAVLSQVISFNGSQPVVTRIKNVTETDFKIGMQEAEARYQKHKTEKIGWIALETGQVEVGKQTLFVGKAQGVTQGRSKKVSFTRFQQPPVFVGDIMSIHGSDPVSLRFLNKTASSIDLRAWEEKSWGLFLGVQLDYFHNPETVGFAVFGTTGLEKANLSPPTENTKNERPENPDGIGSDLYEVGWAHLNISGRKGDVQVFFDNNPDQGWQRINFKNHYNNPVVVATPLTSSDPRPVVIRMRNLDSTGVDISMERWGLYENCPLGGLKIPWSGLAVPVLVYNTPQILATVPGQLGAIPLIGGLAKGVWNLGAGLAKPLVSLVTPFATSIIAVYGSLMPADCVLTGPLFGYYDPTDHGDERVTYMVMEAGHHKIGDFEVDAGIVKHEGLSSASYGSFQDKFSPVNFAKDFGNKNVVVITSIVSFNYKGGIVPRIKNIDSSGFDVTMQIMEKFNSAGINPILQSPFWLGFGPKSEDIAYIAFSQDKGMAGNYDFFVGRTKNVTEEYTKAEFDEFEGFPAILADMQTYKGKDPSNVRLGRIGTNYAEFAIREELSADTEISHGGKLLGVLNVGQPDDVGFVAIGRLKTIIDKNKKIEIETEPPFIKEGTLKKLVIQEPNDTVKFSLKSNDSALDLGSLNIQWRINSENVSNKESFTHKFEKCGVYSVSVEIRDSSNELVASDNVTVDFIGKKCGGFFGSGLVWIESLPPASEGKIVLDENAENKNVTFFAKSSFEGKVFFKWFLNGELVSSEKKFEKEFSGKGEYKVELSGETEDGVLLGNDKVIVFVGDIEVPPEVVCTNPDLSLTFTPDNGVVNPGQKITFRASSPLAGDAHYLWQFGDAGFATGCNPGTCIGCANKPTVQHVYNKEGEFPVTVTVKKKAGLSICSTAPKIGSCTVNIKVKKTQPVLIAEPSDAIVGETILFKLEGDLPDNAEYEWFFDDKSALLGFGKKTKFGETSHVYDKGGAYHPWVKIWVKGSVVAKASTLVTISDLNSDFITANPSSGQAFAPVDVTFTVNSSFGDNAVYEWRFGDGSCLLGVFCGTGNPIVHTYKKGGTYRVELRIKSSEGLPGLKKKLVTAFTTYVVNDGNIAILTTPSPAKGPAPLTVKFEAVSSYPDNMVEYTWNFGDGSCLLGLFCDKGKVVEHTYKKPGTYTIKMNVKSRGTFIIDERFASAVTTVEVLDANVSITADPPSGPVPLEVIFTADSSFGDNAVYEWRFGDDSCGVGGLFCGTGNPIKHVYQNPGRYTVKVNVKSKSLFSLGVLAQAETIVNVSPITAGLCDENNEENCIKIKTNPDPPEIVKGEKVEFEGFSPLEDNAVYEWRFGDGSCLLGVFCKEGRNVSHTYNKEGVFTVELQVQKKGLANIVNLDKVYGYATKKVVVRKDEGIAILTEPDPPIVEAGQKIRFTGSSSFGDNAVYEWRFGDDSCGVGGLFCVKGKFVEHAYKKPGTYTVELTVKSKSTIIDTVYGTATKKVTVKEKTECDGSNCPKDSIQIKTDPDPPEIVRGQMVKFEGVSPFPDSEVEYVWRFGDGFCLQDVFCAKGRFVSHTYEKEGVFTAKLKVRQKGLGLIAGKVYGVTTKEVIVNSDASIKILTDPDPPEIMVGETITFTGESGLGASADYEWRFGDGSCLLGVFCKTGNPITHKYSKVGTFNVELQVKSKGIGIDTLFGKAFRVVTVNPANTSDQNGVSIKTKPPTGIVLVGDQIEFEGVSPFPDSETIYEWRFGDGSCPLGVFCEKGRFVSHVYSKPGIYTVELQVQGKRVLNELLPQVKGSATTRVEVRDLNVGIVADVTTGPAPLTVTFTGESGLGASADYEWRFGDGSCLLGVFCEVGNPVVHTYKKPGSYKVELQVKTRDTLIDKLYGKAFTIITVTEEQKGDVSIVMTPEDGKVKVLEEVQFEGRSVWGDNAVYEWRFGDDSCGVGGVFCEKGRFVFHSYGKAGVYTVELTVKRKDLLGSPMGSATVKVEVSDENISIITSPNPPKVFVGQDVTFTAESGFGDNAVYEWRFGDGSCLLGVFCKTGNPVVHSYDAIGTYVVKVVAKSKGIGANKVFGKASTTVEVVPENQLRVSIKTVPDPAIVSVNEEVKFEGVSELEDNAVYEWRFGDDSCGVGGVFCEKGRFVFHSYGKAGVYTVELTVREKATKSLVGRATVRVEVSDTGFSISTNPMPPEVLVGQEIVFTGSSPFSDTQVKYEWRFGDGSCLLGVFCKTGKMVSHKYSEKGEYVVELRVLSKNLLSTLKGKAFSVVKVFDLPEQDQNILVEVSPQPGIVGMPVVFTANVENIGSEDNLSFEWFFGDGSSLLGLIGAKGKTVEHTYKKSGVFNAKLKVFNNKKLLSVKEFEVLINDPSLLITAFPPVGPAPLTVTFTAKSELTAGEADFEWRFGDGSCLLGLFCATGNPVIHTYKRPGMYRVELRVNAKGLLENKLFAKAFTVVEVTSGLDGEIKIKTDPEPAVIFAGQSVRFEAVSEIGDDLKFEWRFGDGSCLLGLFCATGKFVEHTYNKEGVYTVSLKAKKNDLLGKTVGSAVKQVIVNSPDVNIVLNPSVGPAPLTVTFTGGSSAGVDADFEWRFGDGSCLLGVFCEVGNPVVHTYKKPGKYVVELRVKTKNTLIDTPFGRAFALVEVTDGQVGDLEIKTVPDPAIVEVREKIEFEAVSNLSETNTKFVWKFGDGSTPFGVKGRFVSHEYEKPGIYTVELRAIDKKTGKVLVGVSKKVSVNDPNFSILTDPSPPIVEMGEKIWFTGQSPYNEDADFEWRFGDGSCLLGVFCKTGISVSHTYKKPGQYNVELRVKQKGGLTPLAKTFGRAFILVKVVPSVLKGKDLNAVISVVPEPVFGKVPFTVSFDASKSVIPSNAKSPVFEWEFGDGSKAEGTTVQHTYTKPGLYRAKLVLTVLINKVKKSVEAEKIVAASFSSGFIVPPYGTRLLRQKVSLFGPLEEPLKVGLKLQYTDDKIVSFKELSSEERVLVYGNSFDKASFGVTVKGNSENSCVGPDGTLGVTGPEIVPRLLYSWQWSDIGINACDAGTDKEYIFCDSTQFAIELAKKLNEYSDEIEAGNLQDALPLLSFKAYLMDDGFSDDFLEDFVFHYTNNSFFKAPSFFVSGSRPWKDYFVPERLVFNPKTLEGPGLYDVTVVVSFDSPEKKFFSQGMPSARVNVNLVKIDSSVADSALYYYPFDGLVGLGKTDSSGRIERNGYGTGFLQGSPELSITGEDKGFVVTGNINALKNLSSEKIEDFFVLNNSLRGKVLAFDRTQNKIVFSPSYLVPVVLAVESRNSVAEAYFMVQEASQVLGEGKNNVTFWSMIGASPLLQCSPFNYQGKFDMIPDVRAVELGETPCAVQEDNQPSFGFRFSPVDENKTVYFAGIFFVPLQKDIILRNACSSSPSKIFSGSSVSNSFSELISLKVSGLRLATIEQVLNLVKERRVCITENQGKTEFFWNKNWVFDSGLKDTIQTIQEKQEINWENFKCDVSGKGG